MYWDQQAECMGRGELEKLQLSRLQTTVRLMYEKAPYYSKKMKDAGVTPEDIRSLDDIRKLPFTDKTDLRDNYPFDTFTAPMEDIARIHASSGTTGKPTVVGYTQDDLNVWSELMARALTVSGATKKTVIQNAYGYGLFTGGLGVHAGAERIGASIIPISGGNTQRQIMVMQDFGSEMLTCTPSYALYLAEVIKEMGIDPQKDLKLKYGVFGAEPWTEGMRQDIQKKLGIRATDIYGLSEVMGPGVAVECECQCGLHIFEDHFIPEVVNPETGDPVSDGELGELVLTTITKKGMPVLRYRTHDITTITHEVCECGRTHARISKFVGRSDDMLIIRGVNVFPSQIEGLLVTYADVEPHYLIIVDRVNNTDTMEVWVEMSNDLFSDTIRTVEKVRDSISAELHSLLGLHVKVKLVEPKSIERSEGKARHVVDKRKL